MWFRQNAKTTAFAETQVLLSVESSKDIEHNIFCARDKDNHYVFNMQYDGKILHEGYIGSFDDDKDNISFES